MKKPAPSSRFLPLVLVLSGCPVSSGSFDFAALGVYSTDESGAATELGCDRLPALLGSRSHHEYADPSGVRVVIDATSEQVKVQFQGAAGSPSRVITADKLRSGYTGTETIVHNGATLVFHLNGGRCDATK